MLCKLSKTVRIGLFKARACNRNVAGFFYFVKQAKRKGEKRGKSSVFSLMSSRFPPPLEEIEEALPPK